MARVIRIEDYKWPSWLLPKPEPRFRYCEELTTIAYSYICVGKAEYVVTINNSVIKFMCGVHALRYENEILEETQV